MKNIIRLIVSAALTALVLMACDRTEAPDLTFEAAWIRALPPGMKMTAGFGKLTNRGKKDIELTGFSSPAFGDVSLHRTELVDGQSRMREVPVLTIPPGASTELAPGDYHLMLMMPVEPVATGSVLTITMQAADGRSFSFDVAVERR